MAKGKSKDAGKQDDVLLGNGVRNLNLSLQLWI